MEKAILNLDILNISQGMNDSFSHQGNLAIDVTGCSYLKAPFTGVIKKIYPQCNAVWLESIEKVEYADGTIDYMTIMTMHDNDVSDLYVGKLIKQGDIFYQQGVKGYATGPHIQISVGKGKFYGSGWYENQQGSWCINNQYDITKALFLHTNVRIINSMYNWKTTVYSTLVNANKSIDEMASEVIQGKWGNNPERKQRLIQAGYDYVAIQNRVNELLSTPSDSKIIHIVEQGEYLIMIAAKYNKDWRRIASDNNIKSPWIIYPGQKLIIYK